MGTRNPKLFTIFAATFTLKTRIAMDFTGLHKKIFIHFLITFIMLLIPATSIAAPQQQTDIKKPTRERVNSSNKKGNDKKNDTQSSSTNKKDDKSTVSNKKDDKGTATNKKDDKGAATNKKDDKGAVTNKKDDKPAPVTLLQTQSTNEIKTNDNKPVQDTTNKQAKPTQTRRPPVNTETVQFDGIDVSKHQGTINWEELKKNTKIKFVYIKATEGSDYLDPRYKENMREAKRHGFKVGSYHFLTNRSSATNQFNNFARNVNRTDQDLLPIIDVEECNRWTSQQLRDSLKVFADLVEELYGCKPMIYTSEKFFTKHLGRAFSGYPLFIAKYNSSQPEIGYKWVLWQFSDRGYFKAVKGNRGEVDLSRFNKGYSINDIIYKPGNYKPKISVKDAVDHKEKPATINATEQNGKETPKTTTKQSAEDKKKAEEKRKAEEKKKAEKEAKNKEQKKKQAQEEAKKKAKEQAEADKKAKQKAEQQKREKERQEAAQKAAEEKAKRKAAAKTAREEKAKQGAANKSNKKTANVRGALTQSQRNDSIRAAKQKGQKINKSSADND